MNKSFSYVSLDTSSPVHRLQVKHPKATATISLLGGQLLSFTPKGKQDLIWLSLSSDLSGARSIRGGAPICWPWFGPAKVEGEPQHGYVRNLLWQVSDIKETDHHVTIELVAPVAPLLEKGIHAQIKVRYIIDDELDVSLITYNLHNKVFEFSQAIHSYFLVDDIERVKIAGLGKSEYLDKVSGSPGLQEGEVTIAGETDRIYHTREPVVVIRDGSRTIELRSSGHDSIVVWNPWADKAAEMMDFDDQGYRKMVCVETANTVPHAMLPGSVSVISQRIGCLPGSSK